MPFFFRSRQLFLQGSVFRFERLNTFRQLLGFVAPFFTALVYIVDTILQTFGVRFESHVFFLPIVPTPLQEPSLSPRRAGVCGRMIIVMVRSHVDFLIPVVIENLQSHSATNLTNPRKPKTLKSPMVFISPPPAPLPEGEGRNAQCFLMKMLCCFHQPTPRLVMLSDLAFRESRRSFTQIAKIVSFYSLGLN